MIAQVEKDVTYKGKPFERIGRKTAAFLNSSWVSEVTSRVAMSHSFGGKNGLSC